MLQILMQPVQSKGLTYFRHAVPQQATHEADLIRDLLAERFVEAREAEGTSTDSAAGAPLHRLQQNAAKIRALLQDMELQVRAGSVPFHLCSTSQVCEEASRCRLLASGKPQQEQQIGKLQAATCSEQGQLAE